MVDITKCSGYDCPKKNTCYRYKAKPSEIGQSYFMEKPYTKTKGKIICDVYWEMKK